VAHILRVGLFSFPTMNDFMTVKPVKSV